MKCELCHKNDAEVAIHTDAANGENELYVCKECARRDRVRRQKKSQRTRKVAGLPPGMSMSITEISGEGDAPPPFIEALMDAVGGLVGDLSGSRAEESSASEKESAPRTADDDYHTFPCARISEKFRIGSRLHLEGLSLVGELEPVHRAMRALGMRLVGVEADGVHDAGHVYEIQYLGTAERAKRIVRDLLTQERNARVRLVNNLPRIFGDSLCRALAILKNCRMLSPAECFDILSPLRLAAQEKMLDGITYDEICRLSNGMDLESKEDNMEPDERDQLDATRADEMNARFLDVVLNERAEGKFLES